MLAIHAGAGRVTRERTAPDEERAIRAALRACLEAGRDALLRGASALDAVELAVALLEDEPRFNAGVGSVLTAAGTVEMDAAVMDGRHRAAGAVAAVSRVAHPVRAARLVLERSPHVLLAGEPAERFALGAGAEPADPAQLVTAERRAQLERARERARVSLDHDEEPGGTVGAVARDARGHLAAATSTGGMTNQLSGRVGDSPLVGAGIWADDATCAVSGTGHGEAFIRSAFAHEVDARMRHAGAALEQACAAALARVAELGAQGGCAAVDREGSVALPFTTPGMLRGRVRGSEPVAVALFADE